MEDSLKLAGDLLSRDLHEQITAYRLTVPFLAGILHVDSPALVTLLFQVVPSIATLALLFYNGSKRLGPRVSLPLTMAFGLSFLLFFTFYYGGIFDPITHLALAVVMTAANPVVGFFCSFAGFINDERFLIAVPFALLWHHRGGGALALLRETWKPSIGVAVGLLAALTFRHALTAGWIGPGIHITQSYRLTWQELVAEFRPYATRSFAAGWAVFGLNAFMSFRWTWLLAALFFLRPNRLFSTTFRIAFLIVFVPPFLSSAIVMDVAKSIGYLFPALFFCAVNALAAPEPPPAFQTAQRLWLLVLALAVTPVCCINGVFPAFWLPLPIEAVRNVAISLWGFDFIREWIMPAVHSEEILVPKSAWDKPPQN